MQKKRNKKAIVLFWVLAVAWGLVMFVFSGQSANESGRLSGQIAVFILRIFPKLPLDYNTLHVLVRKTAHFGIFAVEGFLLGTAMMLSFPRKLQGGIAAAAVCTVVAVLNEYHQTFSEGRSCEVRDMIIDSCGAAVGAIAAALVLWLIRSKRERRNVIIS